MPPTKDARDADALVVGRDGALLLRRVKEAPDLPWLGDLPAVHVLRAVWEQQYRDEQPGERVAGGAPQEHDGVLRWRAPVDMPLPGDRLESPDDPAARFATKRATVWRGYKVQVTETCDDDRPHLITAVQTTPAPLPDVTMTQSIEQALLDEDLPPAEHFVDAGYTEAGWLVERPRHVGISVIGPLRADGSWQAQSRREGLSTYDVTQFQLDWQRHEATCPQGQRSSTWTPYHDRAGNPVVSIKFSRPVCRPVCRACPVRTQCTRSARQARQLSVRIGADCAALARLRAAQQTPEWRAHYHKRAGVEGTVAQGVRCMGLRQARFVGLLGSTRPICNTSQLRWPSISCASPTGWRASPLPRPAVHGSHDSL